MSAIAVTFTADTVGFSTDSVGRTLAGLAVPFGVPSSPSTDGHRYEFNTPPTNVDELVDVVEEHRTDHLAGRLAEPWEITDAGLNAKARIFATTRGNDILTEYAEGARTGFSVGAVIADYSTRPDGVRAVTNWTAAHLGVVRRPAFGDAQINLRTSAQEGPTMPEETTPAVVELPTIAELAAKVADVLKPADEETHPLAKFSSLAHFADTFQKADEETREGLAAAFAVPDQITGDNPGVMPPGWRTDIKMRLDSRRPAISALGSIGLPDTGMEANWPYLDPSLDLDAIIAQQETQKTELAGVKIKILKGSAPIKTAGTVSDISYQLLLRSSPEYLAAYLRICMAAWARYTEAKFEAELIAKGTNAGTLDISSASAFRASLFEASAAVEDATGAPADVVLVDGATFITLGGMDELHNPKYGTQNAAGTADASTLKINVNGLEVKKAPFFAADTALVTNSEAAKFAETGPMVATAEDVRKLGRDVAVWGMYEDAEVYFPAGIQVYKPAG